MQKILGINSFLALQLNLLNKLNTNKTIKLVNFKLTRVAITKFLVSNEQSTRVDGQVPLSWVDGEHYLCDN